MTATPCRHRYAIQLGFNTGMSIRCIACEKRFVLKRPISAVLVYLPLLMVCVAAAWFVRGQGGALFAWLGMPLVLGGVVWEILQALCALICTAVNRVGRLELLIRAKDGNGGEMNG